MYPRSGLIGSHWNVRIWERSGTVAARTSTNRHPGPAQQGPSRARTASSSITDSTQVPTALKTTQHRGVYKDDVVVWYRKRDVVTSHNDDTCTPSSSPRSRSTTLYEHALNKTRNASQPKMRAAKKSGRTSQPPTGMSHMMHTTLRLRT